MRLTTRVLTIAALACATPLVAQKESKSVASGTWTGWIGRSEANPRSAKFELKVTSDGSVSGKLSGAEIAPGEITSGKYDANTGVIKFIAWVKAADGSNKGGDVQFEGRVANDSITGAMKLGDETGMFRLSKGEQNVGYALSRDGKAEFVREDPALVAARRGFVEVSGWITRAAEMVPAEKYSYKPTSSVRSFGEIVAHVADGAHFYCANGTGKKTEWSDATEKGASSKAAIAAALKKAFAECEASYKEGKAIAPLIENIGHSSLHYGNIVTYMRMMGLVPPSSG